MARRLTEHMAARPSVARRHGSRRRWLALAATALLVVAACSKKDEAAGADGGDASKAPERTLGASELCQKVFEAPRAHLQTRCSAADKATKEYAYLIEVASEPVAGCTAALDAAVKAGRVKLPADRAERCAEVLTERSWKDTLVDRRLGRFEACREVVVGLQGDGQACRSHLECSKGRWCSRESEGEEGVCRGSGSEGGRCQPAAFAYLESTFVGCGAGRRCAGRRADPEYALGFAAIDPAGSRPATSGAGAASADPLSARGSAGDGAVGKGAEGGTGTRARGEEGSMGRPSSGSSGNRYGVRGPADNPDPLLARRAALRDAAEFGMLGLLNMGSYSAQWRGLDAISRCPRPHADGAGRAGASLVFSCPADQPGPGGFGLDGIGGVSGDGIIGRGSVDPGLPGGGRGTGQGYGLGRSQPSSSHRGSVPQVRMGATSVSGRLAPEIIQRIVRQSFGRLRLCYENALQRSPDLQGRVTVRFVIGRDGSVSNVGAGGDLADQNVVSCVSRSFYGLRFPAPEGGIVTVSYPIVFSPGAGRAPSPGAGSSRAPDAGAPMVADAGGAPDLPPTDTPPPRGVGQATGPTDCAKAQARGESCLVSRECGGGLVCHHGSCESRPRGVAGDPCSPEITCQMGLYCATTATHAWPHGDCRQRKAAGSACTSSLQCQGYCSPAGTCAPFCQGP